MILVRVENEQFDLIKFESFWKNDRLDYHSRSSFYHYFIFRLMRMLACPGLDLPSTLAIAVPTPTGLRTRAIPDLEFQHISGTTLRLNRVLYAAEAELAAVFSCDKTAIAPTCARA